MHTTNYYDTLILPSPDTTATSAQPPAKPGTVAAMTYERLVAQPYALTSDDIIFSSWRIAKVLMRKSAARRGWSSFPGDRHVCAVPLWSRPWAGRCITTQRGAWR